MVDLTIKFNAKDENFKNQIVNEFGDGVDFYETKGFDGSEFVFVAVIPIAALTFQVIDFFMNHFSKKKDSGRVIIKENRDIIIEGYSADEVKSILETILVDDNEED